MENKKTVLSLFCGAGGLDLGVELSGLDALLGKEYTNKNYQSKNQFEQIRNKGLFENIYSTDHFEEALQTYRANASNTTQIHKADIRKIEHFPAADVVLGGFPCPGFSSAGPRLVDDPRNFLYIHYIRCLKQVQPEFFIAENVKGMLTLGGGKIFEQIKEDFESAGYRVYHKLVNARDYGVPQLRERVFLIGVRHDLPFEYEFKSPTHGEGLTPYKSLKGAIGDLENNPGEVFEGGFSSIYMSRNRKKNWDEQSFTIQASGRQAPLHPGGEPMVKIEKDLWELPGDSNDHRRLSVKEVARIQTFPDWYVFKSETKKKISKNGRLDKIYKQIGNAVPVELARVIAEPIANWYTNNQEN